MKPNFHSKSTLLLFIDWSHFITRILLITLAYLEHNRRHVFQNSVSSFYWTVSCEKLAEKEYKITNRCLSKPFLPSSNHFQSRLLLVRCLWGRPKWISWIRSNPAKPRFSSPSGLQQHQQLGLLQKLQGKQNFDFWSTIWFAQILS